jgi:hypothetical protein
MMDKEVFRLRYQDNDPLRYWLDHVGLLRPLRAAKRRWESYNLQLRALCGHTLVPKDALTALYRDLLGLLKDKADGQSLGDYLEFGVCHGTSMAAMWTAIKDSHVVDMRLFGFDSFEGLPPETEETEDCWRSGQFRSSLEFARYILSRENVDWQRVTLIKGWFKDTATPETARRFNIEKAGIIMIDCDIYPAAVEALAFCGPLIRDRAVILFDDWHSGNLARRNLGEKKAFDEFLAANPDLVTTPLPTYCDNAAVFLVERNPSAAFTRP